MSVVHVFVTTGRFTSDEQMRDFIEPTYTDDDDMVPSRFMRETGLEDFEPFAIERSCSESAMPVQQLLRNASYASQWIDQCDPHLQADSAICVFPPNLVTAPRNSSMQYCGAFTYTTPPY